MGQVVRFDDGQHPESTVDEGPSSFQLDPALRLVDQPPSLPRPVPQQSSSHISPLPPTLPLTMNDSSFQLDPALIDQPSRAVPQHPSSQVTPPPPAPPAPPALPALPESSVTPPPLSPMLPLSASVTQTRKRIREDPFGNESELSEEDESQPAESTSQPPQKKKAPTTTSQSESLTLASQGKPKARSKPRPKPKRKSGAQGTKK